MTQVAKSYLCPLCNRKFYSVSVSVKNAYTRHLGQCTRYVQPSSNSHSSNAVTSKAVNDIIYIQREFSSLTDIPIDFFNETSECDDNEVPMDADSDKLYQGVPDAAVQEAYEIYGADRVMIDATLSGEHLLLSKEEKRNPCNKVLDFQEMLQQHYIRNKDGSLCKKPIIIRNLSGNDQIPRYWEDTVEIFNLWVSMNVSIHEGDKILSTFTSICLRNFNVAPQLPKSMKSIVEACKGVEEELFPSKTWIFHLPTKLFGDKGLDGAPLKPTTAVIRDIGSVIGRSLLDVTLENFAFAPDIITSKIDGQRLFGSFSTGTQFERLHKEVLIHAENSHTDTNQVVALALAISSDVTTLNKSQSVDGNGLQILLMNICGKERKPNLLGMIPEKNNAYSVRQLHQLLKNRGLKFKKDRTAIIAYVNRQMKLSYISEALSPLLLYQQRGMTLQVGNGGDSGESKLIRGFPHVVLILADTLEANQYAGVSMKTKRQCRCCMQGNCNECLIDLAIGDLRGQNHHNIISTLAGTIQELMWVYTAEHGGKKLKLTIHQRNVLNEASRLCIQFGHNPMYVHFSLQNSWRINSLHEALLPDSLHTWSKGLVENLISQTLICFRQVARLDTNFSHNLSMLDTNISSFPAHHSLCPWKFSRFPRGITSFQKKNKSKKEGTCVTGFFSGSIAAYRLSGLLAQILFSIRLDGTSLPTGIASNNMYSANIHTNQSLNRIDMADIQNTLVEAIVIALDFDMYSRAPFMKTTDIEVYKRLLSNTTFKFIKCFRMNSILSQLRKQTPTISRSVTICAKNPGGVKMHLLFHTVHNIERVGKEKSSTDTEITESYQKVIKNASQRGTQKTRTEGVEIVKIVNRNLRSKELQSLMTSKSISEQSVSYRESANIVEYNDESALQFVVAKNCSHQNISLDRTNRTIVVEESFKNCNGKRVSFLPLLHELLSLDVLYRLLDGKYDNIEDRQIRLLNSLKCNGSTLHGIDPFMIHANSNFHTEMGGHISIQSKRQDFGFVMVDIEDDYGIIEQFTALVVGIIEESSINRLEGDRTIFRREILVCWLHSVGERDKIRTIIPYPQSQLTFMNNSASSPLWFDIVSTSAIKSPIFVIPIISSIHKYCFGQSIVGHAKNIKFFELNVERVIFWSSSGYDNFTLGTEALDLESQLSIVDTTLLNQEDIANQSESWISEVSTVAVSDTNLEVSDCETEHNANDQIQTSDNQDIDETEDDYDLDESGDDEDNYDF